MRPGHREHCSSSVVLFGSPGVGKGVQARRLAALLGVPRVSTGEILRDEIARRTPLGLRIGEALDRGQFADDAAVFRLVEAEFGRPEFSRGFVFDGFPRTVDQARRFDDILAADGRQLSRAVLLDAPEIVVLRRLAGRLVCASCGESFHIEFRPPHRGHVCDACSGDVVRRADDAPETYRPRLRTYIERTRPLLDYYEKAGILVVVDASGPIAEVEAEISLRLGVGQDTTSWS
jgi:adenylate kinase